MLDACFFEIVKWFVQAFSFDRNRSKKGFKEIKRKDADIKLKVCRGSLCLARRKFPGNVTFPDFAQLSNSHFFIVNFD